MNLFQKLFQKKEVSETSAIATASMVGNPIIINPNDDERIRQIKYRLGAIMRYVQQEKAEGRFISEEKMQHFENEFAELRSRLARLVAAQEKVGE